MAETSSRKPPWEAFPYLWGSLGWRMGPGEDYWCDFCYWFESLNHAERDRYVVEHPEPPGWRYFYEYIGLGGRRDPDAEKRRARLHDLIDAAQLEYYEAEYQLGLAAERAGQIDQALAHYDIAVRSGRCPDADERWDRLHEMTRVPRVGPDAKHL